NPLPVSARSLGDKYQPTPRREPPGDAVALLRGAAHLPVDKDRTLQFGEPAEQRPARDLSLRDEGTGDQRAEDRDIEIGDVIGGEQHRTHGCRPADPAHPQTEDAAAPAVIKARKGRNPA